MNIFFFFAFVALSHGLSLLLAKRLNYRLLSFRTRLWRFHYIFNGTLWLALTSWIIKIQFGQQALHFSPSVQILGLIFLFFGLYLASTSFRLLGMNGVMGVRFFFPEKSKRIMSGLYKYIQNPTYDGIILMLVGGGLWLGVPADFYLATTSFFLLNYFLASVENYRLTLNPL